MITSLKKSIKIFKFENFGILLFLIFIIPFLCTGAGAGVITAVKIPEFIIDFIYANTLFIIIFTIFIILLFWILLRWIYSLNYYFIEDMSFIQSCKKSSNLGRAKHIKDWIYITIVQIILFVAFILVLAIGIFLILLFDKVFPFLVNLDMLLINLYVVILLELYFIMCMPVFFISISVLFYKHKKQKQ